MNKVVYYSNTGGCKRVAEEVAKGLGYALSAIEEEEERQFDNLVLVFPVHCQNIPKIVLAFAKACSANAVCALAGYGKMSYGNVLRELSKRTKLPIVSAAYLPMKHAYVAEDTPFTAYEKLGFIAEKFKTPTLVRIPRALKNPFSNFFPRLRSCLGVRLKKGSACDGCGVCQSVCGNKKCIRCLRCVESCPRGAMEYRLGFFMKGYLKKRKKNQLVIYE